MTDGLREEIERAYVVEREGWAAERAARVTERLQADTAAGDRLETLVVWWAEHNAFTTFGSTIYISRRLFERLPDDDAAAFVIAHELAHHRLGHIPKAAWSWLPVRVMLALLDHRLHGRDREAQADLLAIELCMTAGYDPERCLAALEILTHVSLDYGDVDGVLGGERRSTHPPLQARFAAARTHAAAVRAGARLDVQRAIASDRERRRKRMVAAAGVAAGAAVALLVLRRA